MSKKHRATDADESETSKRATPFQWAGLVLANVGPIKALLILILGTGTIYGNSDTVKEWFHNPDDIAPVNQTYSEAFEKINEKFKSVDAELKKLKNRDYANDQKVMTEIGKLKKLVN